MVLIGEMVAQPCVIVECPDRLAGVSEEVLGAPVRRQVVVVTRILTYLQKKNESKEEEENIGKNDGL